LDSQLPLEDPTPPSPSCFVRASRLSLKRKNPFYLTQSKQLQPALSLSVECVTTTATPSQQGIPGLVVFYVYDICIVKDPRGEKLQIPFSNGFKLNFLTF
jgi:hypothetical protein